MPSTCESNRKYPVREHFFSRTWQLAVSSRIELDLVCTYSARATGGVDADSEEVVQKFVTSAKETPYRFMQSAPPKATVQIF